MNNTESPSSTIQQMLFQCVMSIGNEPPSMYNVFATASTTGVEFVCDFPYWHRRWAKHNTLDGDHRVEIAIHARCRENTHFVNAEVITAETIQIFMGDAKNHGSLHIRVPARIVNIARANDYEKINLNMKLELNENGICPTRFSMFVSNILCDQWLETHKKYEKFKLADG